MTILNEHTLVSHCVRLLRSAASSGMSSKAKMFTMASLKEWITTTDGRSANVVRVMPNTPALVGEGAAGVYASEGTSEQDKQLVNSLLAGISKQTEWVEKDELIDVITGLSGTFCFPPIPRQSPLFTIEGWPPFFCAARHLSSGVSKTARFLFSFFSCWSCREA